MAARLNVEEVLEEVMLDSDDDRSRDDVEEGEDTDREKLVELLESFSVGGVFDKSFFTREAVDLLLPLTRLSRQLGELSLSETDTRVNGKI